MAHYNQYVSTSAKVGGGTPVWVKFPERRLSGGMVKNLLRVGEKVSAGTPVAYDYATHEAKLLKCFKIKTATVNGANTDLVLYRTFMTPELYSGMIIMVMPTTLAGTGKAVVVGTVTSNVETEYRVSLVTAEVDALAANGFLVESSSTVAGAAKSIFCQPDTLSIEDTIGGDQNSLGIPVGYKYVFENTVAAMPAVVKAAIKDIAWESFNEK